MLMVSKYFACALAISSSASWAIANTELECTFDRRSRIKEVMKLRGHHFKISRTEGGYKLAQRYADGTWAALGELTKMIGRDFVVYLHLPPEGVYNSRGLSYAFPRLSCKRKPLAGTLIMPTSGGGRIERSLVN
jgi:hypothetical protein